jgi:hypothetical protein
VTAGRYAQETSVSSAATRDEIERTLVKYGATGFAYGWDAGRAVLGFVIDGRQVRFTIPMPDRGDRRFTHTPARGARRNQDEARRQYDQEVRRLWRALLLVLKAKLEAVASGIVTLEAEFFGHLVLPNGRTVADEAGPQVRRALDTGAVPRLLPALETPALEPAAGSDE